MRSQLGHWHANEGLENASRMISTCVRESRPEEDTLIARHFYRMWLDNGVNPEQILADWEPRVLAFMAAARRSLECRAFVAELDGKHIVASAVCQLFAGLYPDVLHPAQRCYGYLWGVYVEPGHRRRGIARLLSRAATEYLTSVGCTHALLHASPTGRSVYAALGFESTNEMRLSLIR